jgi:hypothetical protein
MSSIIALVYIVLLLISVKLAMNLELLNHAGATL